MPTTSLINLKGMAVNSIDSDQYVDGSIDAAHLSAGSVTEYNDAAIRNDVATLALHSAITDNKAAYNLSNVFVDQYENDTGIDALSNVVRNSAEYMWCAETNGLVTIPNDGTKLLLHFDGNFTDSSDNSVSSTGAGSIATQTTTKKFGTHAIQFDGTDDKLTFAGGSGTPFQLGAGDWGIDFWIYATSAHNEATYRTIYGHQGQDSSNYHALNHRNGTDFLHSYNDVLDTTTGDVRVGDFVHLLVQRADNVLKMWVGGVLCEPTSGLALSKNFSTTNDFALGHDAANLYYTGYMDEFRVSDYAPTKIAGDPLYTGNTTGNFTPPTTPYSAVAAVATGNFTSTTETASATVSKMGIVVLYKNESGSATLDTDLVAQVSSNGGTNYTSAPLTAGGTFSTGISIAKSNDITISNTGTAPKYKISFANQATGTKETRVYGVALLY